MVTDMFGGSPSNLSLMACAASERRILYGANLPMLIKLAGLSQPQELLAVARQMRDHGRNAIWVASDLLHGEKT